MIFDILAKQTGSTYYYRLQRVADKKMWNNVSEAWEDSPDWEDTAISITETPVGGGTYPIESPTNLSGTGPLQVVVYLQLGATPENTDTIAYGNKYNFGSIFGF